MATDGSIDSGEVHAAQLHGIEPARHIVWVDLDLDLRWNESERSVFLKDFEDLVRRWDDMHYPDELVRRAWDSIGEALTRIHRHEWPFDGSFDRYFQEGRLQAPNRSQPLSDIGY